MAGLLFPKPRPSVLGKRERSAAKLTAWRKTRLLVKARDGGHCRICRSEKGYDAHHVVKRSQGGRDELANLIWACRRCHDDIHARCLKVWLGSNGQLLMERAA